MILVGHLAPRSPAWIGALAGVFVSFVPATAFSADGGLETLLFAFLFTVFLVRFLRDSAVRRPLSWTTNTLGVLLTLTRPEGAVVLAAAWITSWEWCRDRRQQVRAALGFLAPGVVVEISRVLYFHQLLPNSVVAKEGTTLAQMLSSAGTDVVRFWKQYAIVIVLAVVTMIVALFRRQRFSHVWPVVPVIAALGAFEVAVSVGDNYPYERYLYSLLPALAALAVAGVAMVGWPTALRRGQHGANRQPRVQRRAVVMLVVLALCAGSGSLAYANREIPWATASYFNVSRGVGRISYLLRSDRLDDHGDIYNYALAGWLRRHQPNRPLVALDEIGIVSYYSNARVIDLIGLANRHIARLPGEMGSRADPAYVFGKRPNDIVFLTGGCICAGLRDDSKYGTDRWMLGYRLTNVFYDGNTVAALLFQRMPRLTSIETLGSQLPARLVTRGPLPAPIIQLLDKAALRAPVRSSDLAANPILAAGGILAVRSTVTMTAPGTTTTMRLSRATGDCSVTATAISPGRVDSASLEATIVSLNGAVLAARAVSLGPGASVRAVTIHLQAQWQDAELQLQDSAGASWAEPYVACRRVRGARSRS
jgi:hypothetical protein